MRKLLIALLVMILPVSSYALDKKIGATNCFKIGIFDTAGNGIAGLDVVTPFSNFAVKLQCGAQTLVTMDETNDTVADEGGGYYYICTNDTIGNANEEECLAWVEGEGSYAGLIAKTPVKFKAVGATMDAVKIASSLCDITAATSGTSFTIGTCIDVNGNSITLATDKWVGSGMIAYTNGAAQCNVEGEYVMVNAVTSGGVVTARTSDVPNSGFKATPSTTNCGVRITP